MKKISLTILLLGLLLSFASGQKVDSIKVEQTGDFIKIAYKILDSKPGQVYRVRVLCSINGGLNTEIRSVSGDTGDNVQGGKPEYFIVWDVLKDVAELTSAEFIVRAELVSNAMQGVTSGNKNPDITKKWSKKWFYIGPAIEAPGPKLGFMAGVMGSFGAVINVGSGKYSVDGDVAVPVGTSIDLDTYLEGKKVIPVTVFLTKRLVNYNSFQMHLLAGMQRSRLIFNIPGAMQTPFSEEKLYGPAAGFSFGINRLAINLTASHLDPGQVEKEPDKDGWIAISPLTYMSLSVGLRF